VSDRVELGGGSNNDRVTTGQSPFRPQVEWWPWETPPLLTAAEVATAIGRDEAYVRRVWRLFGFPDPEQRTIFFPGDIELFRVQAQGAELFGEEHVEHMTRAVGAGTRTILQATVDLAPASFGDFSHLTDDESDLVRSTADRLLRQLIDALPALLLHQAQEALDFLLTNRARGGVEQYLAVGFCDLVDSTPIERAFPATTARAISAFEIYASDVIGRRRGRLVKFVGDEVMFATTQLDDAREIALEIMQWVAEHDHLSFARSGIAVGRVISRDGDLFGTTVNLAARLVSQAAPDTLVVTDASSGDTVTAKGFDDPVRVRTYRRP
jgi:adenylate cyclase